MMGTLWGTSRQLHHANMNTLAYYQETVIVQPKSPQISIFYYGVKLHGKTENEMKM